MIELKQVYATIAPKMSWFTELLTAEQTCKHSTKCIQRA